MTQPPAPSPIPEPPTVAPVQFRHQRLISELAYWRTRRDGIGCMPYAIGLVLSGLGFFFLGSPWNFFCLVAGGVALVLGMIAMTNQSTAGARVEEIERAIRDIELGK